MVYVDGQNISNSCLSHLSSLQRQVLQTQNTCLITDPVRCVLISLENPMSHPRLCPESLLVVATFVKAESDINSLSQTSRLLHCLVNPLLYRYNARDSGSSALVWAAKHGSVRTARLSIQHGARADSMDDSGSTVLASAAGEEHTEIVKLLLETGTG